MLKYSICPRFASDRLVEVTHGVAEIAPGVGDPAADEIGSGRLVDCDRRSTPWRAWSRRPRFQRLWARVTIMEESFGFLARARSASCHGLLVATEEPEGDGTDRAYLPGRRAKSQGRIATASAWPWGLMVLRPPRPERGRPGRSSLFGFRASGEAPTASDWASRVRHLLATLHGFPER